jgi:sodium-dependent dicarboxylate transporter 2/3/5
MRDERARGPEAEAEGDSGRGRHGGVGVRQAAAPYAHELIFLFLGGFMIALAMECWALHRRIALLVVVATGTGPTRLIAGFMLAAAFLSMWISNTAGPCARV